MDTVRLQELIEQFESRRVAVIGDFFLDKYLDTNPSIIEKSVETGMNAHQVIGIRRSAGVAGTVVNNLAALGVGTIHAIGAVGNDGEAFDLRKCLQHLGCTTSGLLTFDSLMTPTYLKPRNVDDPSLRGEHERYDTKNRRPTPPDVIDAVLDVLENVLPELDALIIADQVEEDDCGIITASLRDALAERAMQHTDVVFWVDSRTHIHQFRNVIIKPNEFEAVGHAGPVPGESVEVEDILDALPELRATNRAPVCVTVGQRGMLISDPQPTHIPGCTIEGPVDITGAGDSATAGAVAALASGATLAEAALTGNLVASITIQQLATTGTATPEELVSRLDLWREQNENPSADE